MELLCVTKDVSIEANCSNEADKKIKNWSHAQWKQFCQDNVWCGQGNCQPGSWNMIWIKLLQLNFTYKGNCNKLKFREHSQHSTNWEVWCGWMQVGWSAKYLKVIICCKLYNLIFFCWQFGITTYRETL